MEQYESGEHGWVDDVCRRCGLIRRETWVRDDRRDPVMALMWVSPRRHVVRVRPFPPLRGVAPAAGELVSDPFPPELVGSEPPCPEDPAAWPVADPVW